MYIPIMKTRNEELKVAEELNYCYSNEIIPLFEILNDMYESKYEVDENGKYLMQLKPGKTKREKIKKTKTPDDIITLEEINRIVNKSQVFIDYFRFDVKKYGRNLEINSLELAYKLNNNNEEYIRKLKDISLYDNMIPVFSLKKPFSFTKEKIVQVIQELITFNPSIAIRIEDELYDLYKNIIENNLRATDYLLYDINEQNFNSKIMELEELKICKTKAEKIILNSPRSLKRENKEYENVCITDLIDNVAATEYKTYNFYGFGDYGGLKDQLPTSDRPPNGEGAALALLYNYTDNSFYSFCNSDTSLGLKGYHYVIEEILDYRKNLDTNNNCVAYSKIQSLYDRGKGGNWGTWNNIILTRYIHQIYLGHISKKESF